MRPALAHALVIGAFAAVSHYDSIARAAPAEYPVRPVRMLVPLAPGGGSDIVGRIAAQGLTEHWGKTVVVDNRPGAGSTVGTSIAARAAPDGYTVLVSSSSIAISPALYRHLDFDVRRDFRAVSLIASQPSVLVVHPSVSAASVRDLVALARAQPSMLAYASAGTGSATHLGTELFLHAANARMQHVPYKSAGLATTAVVSGEAQVLLTNMASVMPQVSSGKLKAIGISSAARSPVAPQLPTLAESGLTGFEYATWYGMLFPARTPAAIVGYVHAALAQVLAKPAVAERYTAQGLQIHASTPAQFESYLRKEVERWAALVKHARIEAD